MKPVMTGYIPSIGTECAPREFEDSFFINGLWSLGKRVLIIGKAGMLRQHWKALCRLLHRVDSRSISLPARN
jgi:hypothetical protein